MVLLPGRVDCPRPKELNYAIESRGAAQTGSQKCMPKQLLDRLRHGHLVAGIKKACPESRWCAGEVIRDTDFITFVLALGHLRVACSMVLRGVLPGGCRCCSVKLLLL